MPQQTDPAVPTKLSSVTECLHGRKLRIAGRMLSYDVPTGTMLVSDQDKAVLVDVSLCLDSETVWARETKGVVMITGRVECLPAPVPVPMLPLYCPAPELDPCLVVRALLVTDSADLDLNLWNSSIDSRVQSGHH